MSLNRDTAESIPSTNIHTITLEQLMSKQAKNSNKEKYLDTNILSEISKIHAVGIDVERTTKARWCRASWILLRALVSSDLS
jgi:hypothetical protein